MKFSPMIVERGSVSFDSITLDNGSTLAPVEVAYETYGRLNAAKSSSAGAAPFATAWKMR